MVVGLTGGIGSGKTTVAKLFVELGIPVYFADDEAKKLMVKSPVIKRKIRKVFGEESYVDGELNRPFIAAEVFNDKFKLQKINAIVHPEVAKHFKHWVKQQTTAYVIQENAILYESNSRSRFDYVIAVTAPQEIRLERAMLRDGTTEEEILARISNQMPDEDKVKLSDFVINNIDLKDTIKQVKRLHIVLLGRACKKLKS